MRPFAGLLALGLSVMLGACADMQTISRRTHYLKDPNKGMAIHLDAQQRLVLVGPDGVYCAEPSPDALAAYASSLGLGASVPSQGAASLAQALQSSAGSIGLRTQSITLMRDALYRLCEAYANDQLSDVSATLLLARSQDLTAVVVAIEQLTGAVAANQVILTGTANASASANLVSNQQLLATAREDEAEKQKKLEEAEAARDAQKEVVAAKEAEVAAARAAHEAAIKPDSGVSPEEQARLESELATARKHLNEEQAKLSNLKNEVKLRQTMLAESKRVRETIEKNMDAALTQATAETSGAGQFSPPVQRAQLSKEATKEIAGAVESMVNKVLDKRYIVETCTTLLTNLPGELNSDQSRFLEESRELCRQFILERIGVEKQLTAEFGVDDTSQRIQSALRADPALRERLSRWLESNADGMSPTFLIYSAENEELRRQVIEEFNIP